MSSDLSGDDFAAYMEKAEAAHRAELKAIHERRRQALAGLKELPPDFFTPRRKRTKGQKGAFGKGGIKP